LRRRWVCKELRKNTPFSFVQYTLSIPNVRNTILILSCTPFWPQNSLNLLGHWLYKVSKAFHRDVDSCFPVVWMVDHSWYTQETEHERYCVCSFWKRNTAVHSRSLDAIM
jgi:arabinogalactan endo-1,4-beta-galactosidase